MTEIINEVISSRSAPNSIAFLTTIGLHSIEFTCIREVFNNNNSSPKIGEMNWHHYSWRLFGYKNIKIGIH